MCMRLALVLSLAAATLAATGASNRILLSYCFDPGESAGGGVLNTERNRIYCVNSGSRSYDVGSVTDAAGDVCTIYSLPSAGTKVEYWLVGGQADVRNDVASVRVAAGEQTHAVQYSSQYSFTNPVYVGARFCYISYGVSFAANGGSGSMSALSGKTYDESFALSANVFAKTGYTFSGWKDSAGRTFSNRQTVDGSQFGVVDDGTNVTLTAQWTANTYTVTFDANGGTTPTATKSVTYASTYGTLPTPTKSGYSFAGWYTAASGGTQVTSSTTVSITAAQTLYAHWTANTYTVTFNANGGTTPTATKSVTYASTYGTLPTPTKSGYSFAGWYTAASGGAQVTSSSTVSITAAQTLYAHWTARSFTVTFNPGAKGSVDPTYTTVTYDSTYGTLPTPTRAGYTFGGWWTNSDGTGTQITAATKVTITANQTLYAKWTAQSFNVPFDNLFNYNKYRISESCKIYNPSAGTLDFSSGWPVLTSTASAINASTKWGADGAAGYYTMSVAASTKYRFACAVDQLGSGTVWTDCIAIYFAYDGSGNIIKTDSGANGRVIARGAYEGTYSSGTQYGRILGDFTTPAGCATIQIVIQVFGAGKSARFQNMSVYRYTPYAPTNFSSYGRRRNQKFSDDSGETIGSCMTAADNSWPADPTRTGYTFEGWFNADGGGAGGGTGTRYTTSSKPVPNDDLHLWSKWTANEYTVTLDRQGGSGGPGSMTATYDATMTSITAPTRTGYTFGGYWTGKNGTGTQYYTASGASARTWNLAADTTLYAHWTANTYTVTFDANGGTTPTASKSVTYDADYGELPTPTCPGYTFNGWFTDSTGDVEVTSTNKVSITAAQTLYAHWTANTYTVTFDANGGGGDPMPEQSFSYDEAQSLSSCTFTPPDGVSKFAGWSTNAEDVVVYSDKEIVSNLTTVADGVVELKAVWSVDLSDYSKAMHCYNLNWYVSDAVAWQVVTNTVGAGYGTDSCVWHHETNDVHRLMTTVLTNGVLSFMCKVKPTTDDDSDRYIRVENAGASAYTSVVVRADNDWHEVTLEIAAGEVALYKGTTGDRFEVYIDQMTWTPEGAESEPTEADARDISGISFSDGALSLTFTNADERFSYQLRGTNDLLAVRSLWPVLLTTNGVGTITVEMPVDPEEPQMFYYLRTIGK